MENIYVFAIAVFVIVCIVVLSLLFSKKAIVKRKLRRTPLVPISMFRNEETARIVGKVVLVGEALEAPLSGRKCAYYYIHVEQKTSSGKSTSWRTIIEEEVAGDFVVYESNSCAMIDTKKVKSYIVEDRKYSSGTFHDAEERMEKYLNAHNNESTGFLGFNKALRYKEGILEPGETIAVVGKGQWKRTERTDIPAPYGKILMMIADGNKPVYLSDDPDTVKTGIEL